MALISINVFNATGNEAKQIEDGTSVADAVDILNIDTDRFVVRLNDRTLVDNVNDPRSETSWSTTLRQGDTLTASTPRKITAAAGTTRSI